MKKSILLLSFCFISLFAFSQEFDIREFKADPTDLTLRQTQYQKTTRNGEQSALIKVVTNIRGMKFDSNVGIVDVVHQNDGYWVYVVPRERRITFRLNESDVFIRSANNAPVKSSGANAVFNLPKGEHTFRFIKDGFNEETLTLNVAEEQVVDVNLTPGTTTTQFALSGFVIVASEPSGAEVYLNDQRVGTTPYQGRHIAGTYSLALRYPLYYDHASQFTLAEGATITLPTVKLDPRFGYWQVASSPTDAEVFLNEKYIGNTPLAKAEISSGLYSLKVRKTLYHEHTENFTVQDGDNKSFDISLNPAFGELTVTSDPPGATLFIEGREVGQTPYTNKQQPSGNYNIRLAYDLYSDTHERVTVRDGEKTEKYIPLSKNFGTLKINAPEADIFINDERVGTSDYSANLPPGQYKVKAARSLHKDDEREVYVLLGQTETVNLAPVPRLGAVSVVTQPFAARGAEIFINNKKQKETSPAVIPLLIGNYSVTVKKQGYLDLTLNVDVREGREEEVVFNMQTFEGSMAQQARRYKTAKILYGTAALAALGGGAYFGLSANNLADEYETSTGDAASIYDQMEQNRTISYVAFGVAIPLTVMAIIKASKQRQTQQKINITAMPLNDGLVMGMTVRF